MKKKSHAHFRGQLSRKVVKREGEKEKSRRDTKEKKQRLIKGEIKLKTYPGIHSFNFLSARGKKLHFVLVKLILLQEIVSVRDLLLVCVFVHLGCLY